ncbi:MAG: VOC family protein [Croceibacterium sp.]
MAGFPIWYELMVPDAAAVAPFYRAVLGWQVADSGNQLPNGSEYRMIARADGGSAGGLLTLSPGMAEAGTRPCWMTYFHVADVDAAVAQAQELGATVHMPAVTMPGAGRMAMVADPWGAPFYLMTPTPPPGQPDAKSDLFDVERPGHCRWNQLDTSDEPGADAFYKAVLGWSSDRAMPMGAAGNYRFISVDGVEIGALNPMKLPETPDQWMPYFGVADIGQAHAAALAHGFTILQDIHEVPGGEFTFFGNDPAGARLGLVGKRKAVS